MEWMLSTAMISIRALSRPIAAQSRARILSNFI